MITAEQVKILRQLNNRDAIRINAVHNKEHHKVTAEAGQHLYDGAKAVIIAMDHFNARNIRADFTDGGYQFQDLGHYVIKVLSPA